jgi:His-Xaa-Ser system radical SAM maturase HxsB
MNEEIAKKAVDVALSSPAKHLIFEFQGGEPLLNFETIEYIVHYANEEAKRRDKSLQYNLVSNLTLLTDKMLDFLVCNNIGICTSLDGPEELHNANRPLKGGNSYETLGKWIRKINILYEKSGYDGRVQALQTTTRKSLSHAREIVDEYIQLGIERVFIRPLTPVGYALKNWKHIGYTPEEFLTFYNECFGYIEKQRLHGIRIVEGYAKIFQNRIFGDKNVNFMELRSPCGGAIGQLAYNYDGDIFTCDEGRMIAQTGNKSFKLGDVFNNDYVSLIDNPVARSVCIASCLESIPGCSDCVYSPYCGSCPVVNLVLQNSIFGAMPSNYKCKIYKGILDTIFWRIRDTNVSDVMRV